MPLIALPPARRCTRETRRVKLANTNIAACVAHPPGHDDDDDDYGAPPLARGENVFMEVVRFCLLEIKSVIRESVRVYIRLLLLLLLFVIITIFSVVFFFR